MSYVSIRTCGRFFMKCACGMFCEANQPYHFLPLRGAEHFHHPAGHADALVLVMRQRREGRGLFIRNIPLVLNFFVPLAL